VRPEVDELIHRERLQPRPCGQPLLLADCQRELRTGLFALLHEETKQQTHAGADDDGRNRQPQAELDDDPDIGIAVLVPRPRRLEEIFVLR
jgi:hypothetical protein